MHHDKTLSVGLVACLVSGAASAQTPSMPVPPNRLPAPISMQQPLRIESSMSFQLLSERSADLDQQRQQTEMARKYLYEMTAQECRVLSEVFKGDCRLVNVRVNTNVGMRGSMGDVLNVNGQASYEIMPRP